MPSWNIHLAISKRLSDKYNVSKNMFSFASLIPDYKKELRHMAHFYGLEKYEGFDKAYKIDYKKFLETYKDNLDNSLILGYYAHILADYFYNTHFFQEKIIHNNNGEVIGIKDSNNNINKELMDNIKDIKHEDLEKYGAYLFKNNDIIIPKISDDILNSIKLLKPNFLEEELVYEKIEYLNNEFIKYYGFLKSDNYIIYSKEEYDKLFLDTINFIEKEFDLIGVDKK